jgi:hypothetical protein|tara:strand:+ start:79 stop:357 length:279 start_codon:yes stop_codon:yes gene_type:complete
MPRYKITQHLTGWKIVENFIDAKDNDDAWEKHNKEKYANKEWREAEEEYKLVDTEITKEGDTPTEGAKKWRENKEQGHKEWKKELDRIYKED